MAVDKAIDSTKLNACLDAEANAIRAKTGGTSDILFDFANDKGFADAIAAIPSGDISQGYEITAVNTAGSIVSVDIYGDVPTCCFGYYNNADSVGRYMTSYRFMGGTEKIAYGAFQRTAITEFVIPDSVNAVGGYVVRGCDNLRTYVHENARGLYGYGAGAVNAMNQISAGLTSLQLGAVGKPVTSLYYQFMTPRAYSGLTCTIYCVGANVDSFLASARRAITAGTIVFKASSETEYNGTTYAAGETILTSEVTS